MLKYLVNLVLLFSLGCATLAGAPPTVHIDRIDWKIQNIRMTVAEVFPAGQRTISPNGREIQSRHFIRDGKGGFKEAGDAWERYYAHVKILNDRRPYDVEIFVVREKRVARDGGYTYVVEGYDERLANHLGGKLRAELTKRPEDRNIIDDFRVY